MKRTITSVGALIALLLGVLVVPTPSSAVAVAPALVPVPKGAEADADTMLVRFDVATPSRERDAVLRRHELSAGARPVGATGYVEVPSHGRTRAAVRSRLVGEALVKAVEPNLLRHAMAGANDPYYASGSQAYLDLVRLPEAWDVATPIATQTIAIIDSGVSDHEDLSGRVLGGWDFVGKDDDPSDELGHGTRVAGIAAASTDNGIGIAGAARNANILPVRVLDASGSGTDSDVALGIQWAADHGATVINLSLGGYGGGGPSQQAVQYALDRNVVVVAAAGNLDKDTRYKEPVYPAAYAGVVGVGATDGAGRIVYFSLFGPWVDVVAPGAGIVGTTKGGGYVAGNGTSFASPLVAGAATLVRSAQPLWSQAEVAAQLQSTARGAGLPGRDDVYGAGVLDAAAAVYALPVQAPRAPAAGDGFEPNDTASQAPTLTAPTSVSATIAPEGESDWYRTSIPPATHVTISVVPPPDGELWQSVDPMLSVWTLAGTLVASRDTGGSGQSETYSFDSSGGEFLVDVENFLPTLGSGPYSVTIAFSKLATTVTTTTTTTTTTTPPATSPTTSPPPVAPPPARKRSGYWMVGRDGAVYAFGDAAYHGAPSGLARGVEAVDLEPTPSLDGYWVVTNLGQVHAFGDAPYLGGVDGAVAFGEAVTSISATATGRGYWIFTTKGRVIAFGDAPHLGDMSRVRLNGPVLDSIPSLSGDGYYMVASDGGIFTFGDAVFRGSMGGSQLNAPVQSLVPDADGVGYWLVASDGGIFSFEAPFRGSMGDVRLNGPITGMVRYGNGYLMVGTDGGIFTFTDKEFAGSLGANPPPSSIVAVAAAED
ncbi:MAG TPA: S8 family serine peptidase [Acidimicrobiales bacterium]|nr:S8 family serine peptidase [Acidimicrobiales bacterium]